MAETNLKREMKRKKESSTLPSQMTSLFVTLFLGKRLEHLITNKSGSRASEINFMLYCRCHLVEIQGCKVIQSDQKDRKKHSLVMLDLAIILTQKQIDKRQK